MQQKREQESSAAALRKSHQDEIEIARTEATERARDIEQRLQAELVAAQKQAEEQLAEAVAHVERRELSSIEGLRTEHAEKLSAVENDRDSRVAALESKAQREVSEANDKLAKLDMDASALRGELQSLRESKDAGDAASAATIADLEKRLAETQSARDDLAAKHASATERLTALEGDLAVVREELGQTQEKLAGESSRAGKAASKWEADKQSLERAKDALAVVLAQIEDTEGRTL